MKKEDLYEGFGAVNDDILKRSEKEEGTMKKRNMSKILKIGSLAACLIVALGVGMFFIGGNKTPEVESNTGEESNIVTSTNVDVAPMVYVTGTLYKKSLEEVYYEELLEEFVFVGKIESDITSSQTSTDGVPKENLQANTPIVGSEVYQYGNNVVVKVNGIYWLYEVESAGDKAVDWNSLSEEEKMQLDPTYNAN